MTSVSIICTLFFFLRSLSLRWPSSHVALSPVNRLTWWLMQIPWQYAGEWDWGGFFIPVKSSETVALHNSYLTTLWGTLNQTHSATLLVFVWGINTGWKYLNTWNCGWITYISILSLHIKLCLWAITSFGAHITISFCMQAAYLGKCLCS